MTSNILPLGLAALSGACVAWATTLPFLPSQAQPPAERATIEFPTEAVILRQCRISSEMFARGGASGADYLIGFAEQSGYDDSDREILFRTCTAYIHGISDETLRLTDQVQDLTGQLGRN